MCPWGLLQATPALSHHVPFVLTPCCHSISNYHKVLHFPDGKGSCQTQEETGLPVVSASKETPGPDSSPPPAQELGKALPSSPGSWENSRELSSCEWLQEQLGRGGQAIGAVPQLPCVIPGDVLRDSYYGHVSE